MPNLRSAYESWVSNAGSNGTAVSWHGAVQSWAGGGGQLLCFVSVPGPVRAAAASVLQAGSHCQEGERVAVLSVYLPAGA